MAERRPRPSDFDTRARYYNALLIWLDWRHDDQVDRARKFHKIIQKEDEMPVSRVVKPKPKTALQLAADSELQAMFERADRLPGGVIDQRARIVELVNLDRDLTPDEQTEFNKLVKRYHKRHRESQQFTAAVDRRQTKHPNESRDDSMLAVVNKQSEKQRRRDELHAKRRQAKERKREQERAEFAAQAVAEPENAPMVPTFIEATIPPEVKPARRRRPSYGIVAQFDAFGNRVD